MVHWRPSFPHQRHWACSAPSAVLNTIILVRTGSTIRFWHKVKDWLDQMFWQIYQKLMLSGFLNSGNLCLIHHLKKFWPHTASTASVKKSAIYQWKIGFLALYSTKNDQYWLFWCQWWSDNQDQTFSWGNWPLEAVEASEVAEAAEVSNAWKFTTWTSEASRFLNSIILVLYFDVLKKESFDRIIKT